jgi:hypothetical protein
MFCCCCCVVVLYLFIYIQLNNICQCALHLSQILFIFTYIFILFISSAVLMLQYGLYCVASVLSSGYQENMMNLIYKSAPTTHFIRKELFIDFYTRSNSKKIHMYNTMSTNLMNNRIFILSFSIHFLSSTMQKYCLYSFTNKTNYYIVT